MALSEEIKNLILEHQSIGKIQEQARKQGMISMKQDGLIKVLKGVTTFEEVMRVTKE